MPIANRVQRAAACEAWAARTRRRELERVLRAAMVINPMSAPSCWSRASSASNSWGYARTEMEIKEKRSVAQAGSAGDQKTRTRGATNS